MSQKKMTFSELSKISDGQEPENYYELLGIAFLTESLEAAAKEDAEKALQKKPAPNDGMWKSEEEK